MLMLRITLQSEPRLKPVLQLMQGAGYQSCQEAVYNDLCVGEAGCSSADTTPARQTATRTAAKSKTTVIRCFFIVGPQVRGVTSFGVCHALHLHGNYGKNEEAIGKQHSWGGAQGRKGSRPDGQVEAGRSLCIFTRGCLRQLNTARTSMLSVFSACYTTGNRSGAFGSV